MSAPLGKLVQQVEKVCSEAGWEYRRWTAEDVRGLPGEAGKLFRDLSPKCDTISQQSNLARYLILREVGGLYLDTDVELNKLPLMIEGAWVAGSTSIFQVCSCILACPAHHSWIERVVGLLTKVDLSVRGSAGSKLIAESLADDVSVWSRSCWGRNAQRSEFGAHHWMGDSMGHFTIPPVVVE